MSSPLWLVISLAAGAALGMVYFGGLWFTVKRLLTARHPGLIALASMLVRAAITVAGLFYVSGGRWERLVAAMAGFILVRIILRTVLGPVRELAGTGAEGDVST